MKSNKPLVAILVALILVAMCACVSSVALFGWTLRDEIAQVINDPQSLLETSSPTTQEPEVQTPIGSSVDLGRLFQPVWEVNDILHQDFYDQPVNDSLYAQGAHDGLKASLDALEVNLADLTAAADAPSAAQLADEANTPDELYDAMLPFWETWRRVQYSGVELDTSYEQLMRDALHGAVAAMGDQHTGFMDPVQLRQADLELQGNYEGIGAWVDTGGEYVIIIAPMEGSPAEAAGLRPGDQVLAIDGEDMSKIDSSLAVNRILGPAGSPVTLTIGREGEEPFDVTIIRSRIIVPSVESEMLDGNIAYVQLFTFGADSGRDMRLALEELLAQNPTGLIVDLRNNGGGYLDTAVEITSEFLADGIVLLEDYNDGSRYTFEVQDGGVATTIPMVVLVNGGSASASEILAGALQDYGRASLVGETTFGKGSVQITRMLSDDQGALRVTIARWLTPEGRQIHGLGLEPDYAVLLTQEDVDAQRDPQLDEAIRLLGGN
ncbi:MAG: S41 family peptidase [Anaerolineales bacterium]|nr:MAG: S41 family peptidase [Anaerolineales bacterium]